MSCGSGPEAAAELLRCVMLLLAAHSRLMPLRSLDGPAAARARPAAVAPTPAEAAAAARWLATPPPSLGALPALNGGGLVGRPEGSLPAKTLRSVLLLGCWLAVTAADEEEPARVAAP